MSGWYSRIENVISTETDDDHVRRATALQRKMDRLKKGLTDQSPTAILLRKMRGLRHIIERDYAAMEKRYDVSDMEEA